jgi:hypothetical protein
MKHPSASIAVSLCAAMALGAGICLAAPSPSDATSDAIPQGYLWQHHAVQVNFMGYTSTYTCDGMEGKVRDILRYLGARKDITVHAQGCPRGPDSLERLIWLNIEFDALAPAPAGTATTDLVPAQWQTIQIDSQRPFFMGEGDCELLEALKPMVTANFPVRAFDYSTSCAPYQVSYVDFRVKGEVLKADHGHSG